MTTHEGQDYLQWYYDNSIWKKVYYRGVRTLKSVTDMWNYQEIIFSRDIDWIIETGSRHGGSGLYFADLLAAKNAEGRVISIDVDRTANTAPQHPKLQFVIGDSGSDDLVSTIFETLPKSRKNLLLILDSDHKKTHVSRELNVFVPRLRDGDYLIVEDTCVNGHPVRPEFGDGPYEAIHEFIEKNPDILLPDKEREEKFGFTFAPDGFYSVRELRKNIDKSVAR